MNMSRVGFILVLFEVFAGAARAQYSNGYVFFAPGGVTCCGQTTTTLSLGVGGEVILGKGVGVGLEGGTIALRQAIERSALGVVSPNGYYHFVHGKDLKADPFVTGGYTLMFRQGHANLYNFGGGLNYWFHHRLGARLEIRDHVWHRYGSSLHYWGFRFGLAFH